MLPFLIALAYLLAWVFDVSAQTPTPPAATEQAQSASPRPFSSSHRFEAGGEGFGYTAVVRRYPLLDAAGVLRVNAWATSYLRTNADRTRRPVTFVFNGGPGASSAYLHMGGLGPRRLATPDDGSIPTLPVRVVDNPESWLAFTDLVFFDPAGTGWSRIAQVDGKPGPVGEVWGVEPDVAWAARFIREWLSIHERWSSPILLAGESYGGFRAARLAQALPVQWAVPLAGVVMISPYLEAGLSRGDERLNPMSAALRLPTLAATAWHHDRTAGVDRTEAARDAFLAEVERFAMSDYLPTLALGTAADPSARERVFTRVAAVTGLPLERVRRSEGRIDRELFVKEGLPGHVLGRYDAAVALPDAAPGEARAGDPDPSATLFGAALAAAVNVQLRETLRAQREPPYVLFNGEANRRWDWKRDNGSAAQLRAGMIANPALKVLIAHGRFDLVTPYFVSTHVARQLALPEAQRANIELALLDGGHMMYFHRASRERLFETARGFYARLAEGAR